MNSGLASLQPGSRYLEAHVEAVGGLLGNNEKTIGRAGLEAGWALSRSLGLYAEANAMTDRTWNAGAGLRWHW